MPLSTPFTLSETLRLILLRTPELELAWSREDGSLRLLSHLEGSSVVGHGPLLSGVDVALNTPENWLSTRFFARYLSHRYVLYDETVELTLVIGLGPFKLYDCYSISGELVTRQVSIQNVNDDDVRVYGIRLLLPYVRVGRAEDACFEAPGNSVRPMMPLSIASEQRRGIVPRRFFAPGLRQGRAFEPAPSYGPGLLVLHNGGTASPDHAETLLCWYYSEVEAAVPFIEGVPDHPASQQPAISFGHEVGLAGRLSPEEIVSGGTQYILLRQASWPEVCETFASNWTLSGLLPLTDQAPWIGDAAIYETHPALYGGFCGMAVALPDLAAMGINTLALLPIWSFANPGDRLWDGNWSASGSPYAIRDLDLLDPSLGTPDDLHNLVAQAHSLGMRVIVDFAAHGCAAGSRYVLEHPDWLIKDESGDFTTIQCPGTPLSFMDYYSFDWNNPDLQVYLHDWAIEQIYRYDIDGYRVIAPASTALNWNASVNYHASSANLGLLPLLRRIRQSMRRLKPDTVLLSGLSGPIYTAMHDACYDYMAHHMFVHMALNRITPGELGDYLHDWFAIMPAESPRICFMEKHDTCDFNPLVDGLRGSRISRMLLAGMVLCGFIPALWSGQEQGEEQSISRLLHVRQQHAILRYGQTRYNAIWCDSPQVFAVLRIYEGIHVVGLCNVSPYKQTVTLSLPVDELELNPDYPAYHLYDLLQENIWIEEGISSWRRNELRRLRLTLDPFGHYFLELKPTGG